MPINGLMVTLSDDALAAETAQREMLRHEGLECGERNGRWLPVVAEAANQRAAKELHSWLESLPGVDQVGVILCSLHED